MAVTKQARGLIRSLNRSAVRDDKSPQVRKKTSPLSEPTICARCGAVYVRRTWRHDHELTDTQLKRGEWGFCPACQQVSRLEGQGRLLIRGEGVAAQAKEIRGRIDNVAAQAGKTQPQRKLVSVDKLPRQGGIEVLTTSQKLTHRLAHELKKAFGGRVAYNWSDDGSLLATWDLDNPASSAKAKKKR